MQHLKWYGRNISYQITTHKIIKHNKFKKKIMKRQRNTAQMKAQTRNTEVQINEEEIGKLPEKEFRIMIVKMIKTLKTEWRKCIW